MSSCTCLSDEEMKWRRRSDAHTLAEAEAIRADKERMAGAQLGAQEILAEKTAELSGLTKVAASRKADKVMQSAQRVAQQTSPTFAVPKRGSVLDRHSNPAVIGNLFGK